MRYHIHEFKFESEPVNLHNHKIIGYTDKMLGLNAIHFHFFMGVCSYNSHTHYFAGITGLPIKTENGHIHKMEGTLELNSMHEHKFENFTFEDVSYTARRKFREALV